MEQAIIDSAWVKGYGVIRHHPQTVKRISGLVERLVAERVIASPEEAFEILRAADRVASAAMWLVVHETYARAVHLDGSPLAEEEFKPDPQGHTGGSLNMAPAYTGYMAADRLEDLTRAWLMGQGHCVSAVDSVNLILDNMTPAHAARYSLTDEGLTRYVRDFYSYALDERGKQDSPLGSHVNASTAGGLAEGGYLGFAELQYVHMPLPGERLVAFLSDGAFEEQRGSDWAPRWWRAEDSGLVAPIMIQNGRRIDQRTTLSQSGGVVWLRRHLILNSFEPIVFDGRDPAAFVWAIFEIERRLQEAAQLVRSGARRYPVRLPYGIAVTPKGYGFYGAGTNLAHNLPLPGNPSRDKASARLFNRWARRLWVAPDELEAARSLLKKPAASRRPLERDNALATREVRLEKVPPPGFLPVNERRNDPAGWSRASPMAGIDSGFIATVRANPGLRPRVGNPDEMKSNRMVETLAELKFRVTAPEHGIPESITGAVITALNEEAVAAAALANKGGINITVSYEAFAVKMLGILRQEIIFADHLRKAGRPPKWLSIPLVLTSHLWENGKNEQSHQDPSLSEALMNESLNTSLVLFPPDHNTALATISRVYQTQGQLWTLVVSKSSSIPNLFTAEEAGRLLEDGGLLLEWAGFRRDEPSVILTAIGSYQLLEVLEASRRLVSREIHHAVVYLIEPARFGAPRNEDEASRTARPELVERLYPAGVPARVFVTHTRPEPMLGVLQPLDTSSRTEALGFLNHGGTLDQKGLLWVNGSSWIHVLDAAAGVSGIAREELLSGPEIEALEGKRSPAGVAWS
jgi:phosphoketolase